MASLENGVSGSWHEKQHIWQHRKSIACNNKRLLHQQRAACRDIKHRARDMRWPARPQRGSMTPRTAYALRASHRATATRCCARACRTRLRARTRGVAPRAADAHGARLAVVHCARYRDLVCMRDAVDGLTNSNNATVCAAARLWRNRRTKQRNRVRNCAER